MPFPLPPRDIDRVVLSHAHLDHSGYLPALVRDGFRGQIIATEATRELVRDPAARQRPVAGGRGPGREPARLIEAEAGPPLYTSEDAERALSRIVAVDFNEDFDLGDGLAGRFLPAGHLLGAAIVRVQRGHRSLVFSGDLGRPNDLVMQAPHKVEAADTLIVELTYGDRDHTDDDPEAVLVGAIRETAARGDTVLIPSFAVGRAQALLYALYRLKQREEIAIRN